MLSPARARALSPLLEELAGRTDLRRRLSVDPVELPRRYRDPRDVEVVGLLSAVLAYGRADLFKPKLERILSTMGRSPARFVTALDAQGAARQLRGFVYRFNVATDLAVLELGMGWALRELGSLEALFVRERGRGEGLHATLGGFVGALREAAPLPALRRVLGPERGLAHLLPSPLGAGAAKRLHLFLRWMVRGPDQVDLGVWRQVSPAELCIPVDTHIARLAGRLRLSTRRTPGWRMAEEITQSLRALDPEDPVRFDFALCHHGMSGACPPRLTSGHCRVCPLLPACPTGRRLA